MPDSTTATLPTTRREFREWLRSQGFPKRLSERVAAAFPDETETDTEADDEEVEARELIGLLRGKDAL